MILCLNLLIDRPRPHDGGVVHAHHQHLIDPARAQRVLPREVSRDLTRRSRRRERAGPADDERFFTGETRAHLHRRRPGGLVRLRDDVGELVADGHHRERREVDRARE